MSNIIRKILKQTKDLTNWKFLIKNNFNLANVMGNSVDLKLEELRLERNELEARSKVLMQRQRCVESMLTDLTRSIKQMEFDIDVMQMQKPAEIAPQEQASTEPAQPVKREQKI
ncbi:uncharacterized protein [Drosophila virilis]|uniref:Uncharacterized protein n=1 Tax=Drosophila virilis TaxID=7244 RepID=B4LLX0_DROVI|nr:uncharacterized protein LOC6626033 [Drosophila virilis]EDW61993.1 uncharacterized protein Dvir_GJ20000 [Drosophila virilis]